MLENVVVGLIVVAAAWYAARRLLPAPLRSRLFGKAGAGKGDCDSGCGSCGGCEAAPPLDLEGSGTGNGSGTRAGTVHAGNDDGRRHGSARTANLQVALPDERTAGQAP